jgi:hypothetical protein
VADRVEVQVAVAIVQEGMNDVPSTFFMFPAAPVILLAFT